MSVFDSHVEFSDGTRYKEARLSKHKSGTTLIRDPKKLSGRARKALRKKFKRSIREILNTKGRVI